MIVFKVSHSMIITLPMITSLPSSTALQFSLYSIIKPAGWLLIMVTVMHVWSVYRRVFFVQVRLRALISVCIIADTSITIRIMIIIINKNENVHDCFHDF